MSAVSRDVGTGGLSGVFAGLLAQIVLVFLFLVQTGRGPLYPFQVVASFLVGDAAFGPWSMIAATLGLALLATVALLWGVVFGLCASALGARRGWSLVGLALGVGVIAQVVDLYVVAPLWLSAAWGWDRWAAVAPPATGWVVHLIYGLGLSIFPWLYRALWGVKPRNWYGKRRYDPIDPLGA